jgi:uncharacterized protein (TIRG00374 family)
LTEQSRPVPEPADIVHGGRERGAGLGRPSSPGSRRRLTLIKTAIGVGLLAGLLVWNDNGRKLLEVLSGFQPEYIVALFAIAFALVGVSSVKWSLFLRQRGHAITQARLFSLYLVGYFFNNFIPSSVGGDLARIYILGRQMSSHSESAASVFLERGTGVFGLVVLAALVGLFNQRILTNPIIALTIVAGLLGCTTALVLFYRPAVCAAAVGMIARLPGLRRVAARLDKLIADIGYFRDQYRLLALSLAYSFAFHLLAGLNVYVSCLSIGFEPAFLDILVITPVILLLTMIPVSPNNIGWWEWCFSILLIDAGASAAEGLAVGLTIRAVNLCVSLIGGLLFLSERHDPKVP